ncbi:hypothetical protein [Streptosporangium lutulentum]|uniref:Uncharacterized protein n=1 Tax=Streptosporangium lutulentum TaxID=1461250 RepID=A0ABT9QMY6_9ACTN|nr:hypothetical protein [Streptosporangium lutulentum]MDP9848132.1 hypothetical protein [Streptosporangium lutulentum]
MRRRDAEMAGWEAQDDYYGEHPRPPKVTGSRSLTLSPRDPLTTIGSGPLSMISD